MPCGWQKALTSSRRSFFSGIWHLLSLSCSVTSFQRLYSWRKAVHKILNQNSSPKNFFQFRSRAHNGNFPFPFEPGSIISSLHRSLQGRNSRYRNPGSRIIDLVLLSFRSKSQHYHGQLSHFLPVRARQTHKACTLAPRTSISILPSVCQVSEC